MHLADLWSLTVMEGEGEGSGADLASLAVSAVGALAATGDPWEPYRLLDRDGVPVEPVGGYFRDLQAAGRSGATLRSYGMDLLRWFRFLWAIGVSWDRATRVEARDFCRWLLIAGKPVRSHWRSQDAVMQTSSGVPYAASVRGAQRDGAALLL